MPAWTSTRQEKGENIDHNEKTNRQPPPSNTDNAPPASNGACRFTKYWGYHEFFMWRCTKCDVQHVICTWVWFLCLWSLCVCVSVCIVSVCVIFIYVVSVCIISVYGSQSL